MDDASSPWSDWTTLRFDAGAKPLLEGEVELSLVEEGDRILFESRATARLLGIQITRSRTRSTLDRASGLPREYVSVNPGNGRRYLFEERRYVVHKLEPGEDPDAPIETWVVEERRSFDNPPSVDGRGPAPVLDYYGMLLYLRRLPLNAPGDEASLWVATSDGPRRWVVRVGESREATRVYENLAGDEPLNLTSRELLLRIAPEDDGADARGLLGMSGEVEIWAEAETKTLIQISGKIPNVPGRVQIELKGLALTHATR